MRPSRMWARATPARSASTHDRILGIMPSESLPAASSRVEPGDVDVRDQRRLVGVVLVEAGDVGEVHELLGLQRDRDRAGDGVGVHVVGLAGVVDADGGDHRDELLAGEALDDRRVDALDVAHEAEPRVAHRDLDQAGVLAGEADRVRAVLVERGDDLAVDLADERHAHDVDALGVGDPQAVDELGLLAEPAHEVADLRTAAVHDDRVHAHEAHEHDVLREEVRERGIVHRVAAVLDHDGLARELPDVRQRLGQDRGLLLDARIVEVDHQDVPMFSSTYAWVRSVKSTVASDVAVVEIGDDVDVARFHGGGDRGFVVRVRDAAHAHDVAVVRDVDLLGVEHRAAHAELADDPTPVGVLAVERALHELTRCHRAGRELRFGRGARPLHGDAGELGGAFGVGGHLVGEIGARRGEGVAEHVERGTARPRDRVVAGRAVRQHEDGVVGAAAHVDHQRVEAVR